MSYSYTNKFILRSSTLTSSRRQDKVKTIAYMDQYIKLFYKWYMMTVSRRCKYLLPIIGKKVRVLDTNLVDCKIQMQYTNQSILTKRLKLNLTIQGQTITVTQSIVYTIRIFIFMSIPGTMYPLYLYHQWLF